MFTLREELFIIKNFVRMMSRGPGCNHALSVGLISGILGERLGLDAKRIYIGGLLHDIGAIGIFEKMVSEPLFVEKELEDNVEFKLHPEVSYRMVKEFLNFDFVEINEHHELFNGSGFPAGKAGEDISTGGYVIGIADRFEIISRTKLYGLSEVRKALKEWCGTLYPAFIVDELMALLHEDKRLLYDIQLLISLEERLLDLESRLVFNDISISDNNLFRFFSIAIALKHPYTQEHSERVCYISRLIGDAIGLDNESMSLLEASAYLHDIGKIAVPRGLLDKPTALMPHEARLMVEHTLKTYEILNISRNTKELAFIAACHHEALDGSGYPLGLGYDDIPLITRIITLSDIYDALTSVRAYRGAFSVEEALNIIEKEFKNKIDLELLETLKKLKGGIGYELRKSY